MQIPKSVYLLKDEDKYVAIFTARREVLEFKPDSLMKDTIDQILSGNIDLKNHDLLSRVETLRQLGLISDSNSQYQSKYSKQTSFLSEYMGDSAVSLQEKIENSTIAIFGIGGIGTWLVNGLSQIGVGELRIIDPDVVSLTNLNRQLHFSSEDIGDLKVEVIKKKLPDQRFKAYNAKLNPGSDLSEILEGVDFVFDAADNPSVHETARIINEACTPDGIPYSVCGGYNMHLGMVGPTIIPGETACFQCFTEYQKENDPYSNLQIIKDVEDSGNIGPIAGVVANFHVMEAFKYLTGLGQMNLNKFLEIDFLNMNFEWREFYKREDCPTCSST